MTGPVCPECPAIWAPLFLSPTTDAAVPSSPRAPLESLQNGLGLPLVTGQGAQWKKLPYREMEGSKGRGARALPG